MRLFEWIDSKPSRNAYVIAATDRYGTPRGTVAALKLGYEEEADEVAELIRKHIRVAVGE